MDYTNKVMIITGGAHGIGKTIAEEFTQKGGHALVFDITANDYFTGDLSDKKDLDTFVEKVIHDYGHIDYLINNAMPLFKGIDSCSYDDFTYALQVGVTAPFYLAKAFSPYFREGGCIVNMSSSRYLMSQPQSESYTAAKGGITALTHSLAVSLSGRVRVNAIAPGWIDTSGTEYTGPDALQQPVQRVGNTHDIASLVFFLCSDEAGFITGETICVDGGMTKQMIYSGEHGWQYNPKG